LVNSSGAASAAAPADLRNSRRVGGSFLTGVMLLRGVDLDGKKRHSFRE
jgi:hypothetical protein